MKQLFKILAAGVLCTAIFAFSHNETERSGTKNIPQLEKAKWLIGKWVKNSGDTTMTEKWEKVSDTHYKGSIHYILGGTDTIFSRKLELYEKAGKVTYTMVIEDENNGKPIPFNMTSATNTKIVFEDPKRQYPRKITYTKTGDNSMTTELSGIQDGKPEKGEFQMIRE